ncbi:MAG: hypothetical protein JWO89_2418 [Verrucomicrobiaceae bacterium]|nr:hypothetical protein [Verrucomicrobiaceae bacterium]MDB6116458.1 hypothetical protein [Verrucomicrobiaceae bacterium]
MSDLKDPRWMWCKAVLLLMIGLLAGGLVWLESPNLRTFALLAVCVWGFCRAYYFVFYVIQHYIEPQYRFAGLLDFVRYLMRRK